MAGEPITTLRGNLVANPNLNETPTGKSVVNFRIAQTPWTFDGQNRKDGETVFIDCEAWGKLATKVAQTFAKGDTIIVLGSLRYEEWSDKDTGVKRSKHKIVAESVGADILFSDLTIRKEARPEQQYAQPVQQVAQPQPVQYAQPQPEMVPQPVQYAQPVQQAMQPQPVQQVVQPQPVAVGAGGVEDLFG